jgi:hypothetical protein
VPHTGIGGNPSPLIRQAVQHQARTGQRRPDEELTEPARLPLLCSEQFKLFSKHHDSFFAVPRDTLRTLYTSSVEEFAELRLRMLQLPFSRVR